MKTGDTKIGTPQQSPQFAWLVTSIGYVPVPVIEVLASLWPIIPGFTVETETKLRLDLLSNYAAEVRPNHRMDVRMSFQLTAISGVDLKDQVFSVAGWWSMYWSDPRLSWHRKYYDDIPVVQFYRDKIWTPTVVVDNSVNDLSAINADNIPLRVNESGLVTWNPPGLISVSCEMDKTHFPFDTQICAIEATSFGYTIQELDLYDHDDGINLRYFKGHGEWTLLSTWHERNTYIEGANEYSRVYFYFKVKRKPLSYGLNHILPVLATAFLTVFVFALPPDSGERISYTLTVLLSFMVMLTLIADDLPTTASHTSLLELYIAVVFIMESLAVVLSIYVVSIHHRQDGRPTSGLALRLTTWYGRISRARGFKVCCSLRVDPKDDSSDSNILYGVQNRDKLFSVSNSCKFNNDTTNVDYSDVRTTRDSHPYRKSSLNWRHALPVPTLHLPVDVQHQDQESSLEDEVTWQTVATVLDCLLLRIFTVFLAVSSAVFITLLTTGG
ncbi:hypothetical protein EGW08_009903 [Elysia chlorotica]|uniref:Neurotransmitter-gated ion-channel ligand-binding domain-containing protein n=1 Tax=Elysia chlorotica TaxID=188477 RepID=A0A433TL91_ELYCH|nr:hypothetical protein EGW08_009903 [Elysia chlorotica]